MKKKFLAIFGVMAIIILMISNASALNINQNQKIIKSKQIYEQTKNEKQTYIDPNIHLTKIQLPRLKKAEQQIEVSKYKKVTQEIIKKIEVKGYINSNDIKEILTDLDMAKTDVYSGKIDGSSGYHSTASGIPIMILFNTYCWIGLGIFVKWSVDYIGSGKYLDFIISGQKIETSHDGFALFPIGGWFFNMRYINNNVVSTIDINAYSPLILITYG